MCTETGDLIKKHRKAKGLTMEEAGKKMRPTRSRQQWHQWETGVRGMSMDVLGKIAKALGVKRRDLVGD